MRRGRQGEEVEIGNENRESGNGRKREWTEGMRVGMERREE